MILKVHGCDDEALEHEIKTASYFFGLHLLSRQMIKHIHIEIFLKKSIKDHGSCCITHFNDSGKPRYFEIELKKFKKSDKIISTLAHEFIHLKQFAKLELDEMTSIWKGAEVDIEKVSYHDLPWEIEAASLEPVLLAEYNKYKYFVEKNRESTAEACS
jgi:hypothetical protein